MVLLGGFRGFFGPQLVRWFPGPEGDFEDGDFGPDGGPQGGLGSLFGRRRLRVKMATLVLMASLMSNPVVAWRSSLVAQIRVVTCLHGRS